MGRAFRIVPAVLVRAQVLQNNLGRTYLPAEAINRDWAEMWNNIPVLVGPHPTHAGEPMSGRTPEIMNERCVGWIFGAHADEGPDGVARLSAEVWLDVERASVVPGFSDVLAAVDAGHPVELSTGFSTIPEQQAGNAGGELYEYVLHPLGADHLVISTEMTGACSVHDGCGLGVNAQCPCRGNHQEDIVSTQAQPTDVTPTAEETPSLIKKIFERAAALFAVAEAHSEKMTYEEMASHNMAREMMALQELMPSDQERMQMVREAMQEKFGASDREVIVCDLYSDQHYVVFWFSTPMGAQPKGAEYYRSEYTMSENGKMTFAEPALVRRMTTYVPVGATAANTDPAPPEVVEPTQHTEEVNMAGSETQGQAEILSAIAELTRTVSSLNEKVQQLEAGDATVAGLKRAITALTDKVGNVERLTAPAVEERERERTALVHELAGNPRVTFTAAELESKPVDELRKIANMVATENYAGKGGPQGTQPETRYMKPVSYYNKPAEK